MSDQLQQRSAEQQRLHQILEAPLRTAKSDYTKQQLTSPGQYNLQQTQELLSKPTEEQENRAKNMEAWELYDTLQPLYDVFEKEKKSSRVVVDTNFRDGFLNRNNEPLPPLPPASEWNTYDRFDTDFFQKPKNARDWDGKTT